MVSLIFIFYPSLSACPLSMIQILQFYLNSKSVISPHFYTFIINLLFPDYVQTLLIFFTLQISQLTIECYHVHCNKKNRMPALFQVNSIHKQCDVNTC